MYIFFADAELLVDDQVELFLDGSGPLITDNFAQWDFRGTAGDQALFKEDGQYLEPTLGSEQLWRRWKSRRMPPFVAPCIGIK